MLEKGHSYGEFIWAVEMDSTRIFSGDSDACLVVHDFWEHDTENITENSDTENLTENSDTENLTENSDPKKLKLDPESSNE